MNTPFNRETIHRYLSRTVILFFFLFCLSASRGEAVEEYRIDPGPSHIKGSIKYSVVGRYHAEFNKFSGVLYYDPAQKKLVGVSLTIENASLQSRFDNLDRIVQSPRLLYVEKYPTTTFHSKSMVPVEKNKYIVTGDLSLHGVTREISFPFSAEGPLPKDAPAGISAKGLWIIPRKDYDIYWHEILDKGGILVGNHLKVDWEIHAFKE